MSVQEVIDFDCPSCGSKQKVEIFRSINVTENPELKTELLEGRINIFHCPDCDFEGSLPVDLLYHDMEKQFCVQFFPFQWTAGAGFIRQFGVNEGEIVRVIPDTNTQIPEYFLRAHIVFNMNELIRYLVFMEKVQKKSRK
ncbi:MAG: CpXC domain-containing protein [Candidatus Atribacteria bacterium]|nr:CpXC domain-containing protein [Candidatus Atribacteria bacterium]